MKIPFIAITAAVLLLSACDGKPTENHSHDNGTHIHEDGSVHQNHTEEESSQEEFTVPADSSVNQSQTDSMHMHNSHGHPH